MATVHKVIASDHFDQNNIKSRRTYIIIINSWNHLRIFWTRPPARHVVYVWFSCTYVRSFISNPFATIANDNEDSYRISASQPNSIFWLLQSAHDRGPHAHARRLLRFASHRINYRSRCVVAVMDDDSADGIPNRRLWGEQKNWACWSFGMCDSRQTTRLIPL